MAGNPRLEVIYIKETFHFGWEDWAKNGVRKCTMGESKPARESERKRESKKSGRMLPSSSQRRSGTGHSWHCWLLTHNPSSIPPVRGLNGHSVCTQRPAVYPARGSRLGSSFLRHGPGRLQPRAAKPNKTPSEKALWNQHAAAPALKTHGKINGQLEALRANI